MLVKVLEICDTYTDVIFLVCLLQKKQGKTATGVLDKAELIKISAHLVCTWSIPVSGMHIVAK